MAQFLFANNAQSTLASPPGGGTTFTLTDASSFPSPSAGQQFALTVVDALTNTITEIVYCTSRTGNVLTVARAQEGTTLNSAWSTNDPCANEWTKGQAEAMQQAAVLFPTRTITTSGPFALNAVSDYNGYVGLNRLSGPGVSSATLPTFAASGSLWIEDLAGNFNQFPVTITAPGGTTIRGQASVVLNVNGQCGKFTFYADSNTWSFKA